MNPIVLTLTPEEAQIVVSALAARPYVEVANLIPKIMTQAQVQADAEAAATRAKANGRAPEPPEPPEQPAHQ